MELVPSLDMSNSCEPVVLQYLLPKGSCASSELRGGTAGDTEGPGRPSRAEQKPAADTSVCVPSLHQPRFQIPLSLAITTPVFFVCLLLVFAGDPFHLSCYSVPTASQAQDTSHALCHSVTLVAILPTFCSHERTAAYCSAPEPPALFLPLEPFNPTGVSYPAHIKELGMLVCVPQD